MNEHDRDIEQLLEQMPLREPSQALDAKVLGASQPVVASLRDRSQWRLAGWLSAAALLIAGATLAITLWAAQRHRIDRSGVNGSPLQPPTAIAFDPVRHETVLSHLSDEGVVYLADDLPMRRVRRQTLQRVEWVDAARDIRMETTLPLQEQWMLVPISFD